MWVVLSEHAMLTYCYTATVILVCVWGSYWTFYDTYFFLHYNMNSRDLRILLVDLQIVIKWPQIRWPWRPKLWTKRLIQPLGCWRSVYSVTCRAPRLSHSIKSERLIYKQCIAVVRCAMEWRVSEVDCVWNDSTRAETIFLLSAKQTSLFKSAGVSVQSTVGRRGVHIRVSNAGYNMLRGSVKSTGYPLHSPVSPSLPLPCVNVCHHISNGL
jgi:hypothetical protein